ncbi:thiamine kinase [Escherichia fergusonii]|uniref:thiamine kinase n=1 Tax=Escherichia fergusonii TaxID=564 RepID=UPI0015EA450E|nr:thiamine kinase [Escherichia fergusonii]EGO8190835.1 thiamine kinase [Escherichia fergusonii]MBV7577690.1 thiamine kinase [Escherichia fergusonii]QME63591.1 thiamine kinase [Escherichia fergusonii]QME68199.1 thiamine kinase [Escherichia fergusonii]QME99909.1 thiamine kinase [Escherichia fergusonii]
MQYSSNNSLTRDEILSRYFPQYYLVESCQCGLSGSSVVIENDEQRLVLRRPHDPSSAESIFLRQYHALSRLPETLAPRPRLYRPGWMAVDYLVGEVPSCLPDTNELVCLLYHLHQQPCFGWRILLLPLLEQYWQGSDPARRTPLWLRWLKRLRHVREPQPLRLSPLHMDVHAANLVITAKGLRLIDWEYAGDSDVALELAAVWVENEQQQRALVNDYAHLARIDAGQLWRQVRRWQPWLQMLKAGWFEYRWQQTGEEHFIRLADETWHQF